MHQYKTCAELKDLAKGKLERNYGVSIAAILTVEFIQYLTTNLLLMFIPTSTVTHFIIYRVILALFSIFLGVFELGICLFFLNIACGQPYRSDNIFYGFQNNSTNALIISCIKNGISAITTSIPLICARIYFDTDNQTYFILSIVFTILGFLIYYPISLAISQSFFILLDFPEYSGKQALLSSCKLMKQHIGRFFQLQLSFIPLMILCFFSFNIGFLWLTPYMRMSYTLFFLDIMESKHD